VFYRSHSWLGCWLNIDHHQRADHSRLRRHANRYAHATPPRPTTPSRTEQRLSGRHALPASRLPRRRDIAGGFFSPFTPRASRAPLPRYHAATPSPDADLLSRDCLIEHFRHRHCALPSYRQALLSTPPDTISEIQLPPARIYVETEYPLENATTPAPFLRHARHSFSTIDHAVTREYRLPSDTATLLTG